MASVRRRGTKDSKPVWTLTVFCGWGPDPKQPGQLKKLTKSETFIGSERKALAKAAALERDREQGIVTPGKLTMGELLDDVLLDYQMNGKDLEWATRVVEKHLRPKFAGLSPAKVTTATLRKYVTERMEQGAKGSTINRSLSVLRRAFNLGKKAGKVVVTPFFPMLTESNARTGFIEREQYIALRDALPEYLRPLLAFSYFTGCRRGEMLGLKWSQVDMDSRVVRLKPTETKNKHGRVIPLGQELWQMLVIQKQRRDTYFPNCEHVFFGDEGRPIVDFRRSWRNACYQAGLWQGDEATGNPTVILHDMRRSAIRDMVRSGVPEKQCMEISGHRTRSIFDRYDVVNEADLLEAVRKRDEYHRAKDQAEPEADSEKIPKSPISNGATAHGGGSKLLN